MAKPSQGMTDYKNQSQGVQGISHRPIMILSTKFGGIIQMRWSKFLFIMVLGILINHKVHSVSLKYVREPSFYDALPNVKKGGTLNFKINSDPKVINPLLYDDAESLAVISFLWLPLMTIDPETLKILPSLALSYSISADEKNYTFNLNTNAKWQDGTPVTAADVKFTFEKIMDPKVNSAVLRSYYHGVSLLVKDEYTIVFHVEEPRFDSLFQLIAFDTIQAKQFAQTKDFNQDPGIQHPIGNSPYILSKYERGNKIVFTRNKNWWGYALPHYKNRFNIDEVILRIIPDNNLSYEKFLNGDIDNIPFYPEQWQVKVTGIDKDKFSFSPSSSKKFWVLKAENKFPKPYSYIAWNEKNPIFKNVKTRMALSYLVNYKKIIDKVYYGLSIQSTSPFGSLTSNSAPELRSEKNMIVFNKAKAMMLLKEDGWKNGGNGNLVKNINGKLIPFIFNLNVPSQSPNSPKIAQIIKEDFKSSGIIVNIKSLEWNSFLERVEKRDFDSVILGWTSSLFPNPKQIWDSKSQEGGGSNFVSYNNPKVDALISKANLEFDPQKRNQLMQEINRLIYADQPYTFLTEAKYILEGLNNKIKSSKWLSEYEGGAASDLFYLD